MKGIRISPLLVLLAVPFTYSSVPDSIVRGGSAPAGQADCAAGRLVSWNIERGERLREVAAALKEIRPAIVLLQEVDLHAARTGRADVAQELADTLKMHYLFAPEFEELGQGNRGRPAYHGQAVLTALPASSARVIRFRDQSDFWKPRWYLPNWRIFQRRTGGRLALVAELGSGTERLVVYNVHLESRGSEERRRRQIEDVISDAERYPDNVPIVLAGDLNTRADNTPVAGALIRAGFRQAVGRQVTTAAGKALDWIFVRGPLSFTGGTVHSSVRASDHFPLSVVITSGIPGCRPQLP